MRDWGFRCFLIGYYQNLMLQNLIKNLHLGNKQYGNIFCVFFIVNTPISLQIIYWLLFHRLKFAQFIGILGIAIFQTVGIIGCHLMLTFYSKSIHKPTTLMYSHLIRRQCKSEPNLKPIIQFKFIYLIYMLHTVRRYGITYGPFGLATMETFAKFLILYGKFLMITYKIHATVNTRIVREKLTLF